MSLQQSAAAMAWSPIPSAATPVCPSTASTHGDGRRMSEPCRVGVGLVAEHQQQPPRPHSTLCLPMPLGGAGAILKQELHPNQEVALEEVGEGEMLESKLVIPDEMQQYLNQVSKAYLVRPWQSAA